MAREKKDDATQDSNVNDDGDAYREKEIIIMYVICFNGIKYKKYTAAVAVAVFFFVQIKTVLCHKL